VVRIDFTGAERMLAFLSTVADGRPDRSALDEALNTEAYAFFLHHHNRLGRALSREDLASLLMGLGEGRADGLRHRAFREALARIDHLTRTLDRIRGGRYVERAMRKALEHLPAGADLDCTVYFLLDGESGAYALAGDLAVDLLQVDFEGWLSLENSLAHELHHVGLEGFMPDIDRLPDPERQAVSLLGLCVVEGSALYLIHGYPTGPGPSAKTRGCRADYLRYSSELDMWMSRLERAMERALAGGFNAKSFEREVRAFLEGYMGAAYWVGARMVEAIAVELGRRAAVDILSSLQDFLPTYNRCAEGLGLYRLGPDLTARMAGLLARP